MALITRSFTFSAGAVIVAAQFNTNENTIYNDYNGNIDNTNVVSGAAIAATKLNLATVAQTVQMSAAPIDFAKGSDIASSTGTTNIAGATGNVVDVTGSNNISNFGTVQAGALRIVRFTGALTLKYNATSLILPGSADITTANGDVGGFYSLASGNWKCAWYQRQDGSPVLAMTPASAPTGTVLQVINSEDALVATGTGTIPSDDTIPQNTEGTQFMSASITPNATGNKLYIQAFCNVAQSTGAGQRVIIALFQDSTAGALAATQHVFSGNNQMNVMKLTHYMSAGTTSSTTFKIRIGISAGGTTTFNGESGAELFGGVGASTLTIMEIKG